MIRRVSIAVKPVSTFVYRVIDPPQKNCQQQRRRCFSELIGFDHHVENFHRALAEKEGKPKRSVAPKKRPRFFEYDNVFHENLVITRHPLPPIAQSRIDAEMKLESLFLPPRDTKRHMVTQYQLDRKLQKKSLRRKRRGDLKLTPLVVVAAYQNLIRRYEQNPKLRTDNSTAQHLWDTAIPFSWFVNEAERMTRSGTMDIQQQQQQKQQRLEGRQRLYITQETMALLMLAAVRPLLAPHAMSQRVWTAWKQDISATPATAIGDGSPSSSETGIDVSSVATSPVSSPVADNVNPLYRPNTEDDAAGGCDDIDIDDHTANPLYRPVTRVRSNERGIPADTGLYTIFRWSLRSISKNNDELLPIDDRQSNLISGMLEPYVPMWLTQLHNTCWTWHAKYSRTGKTKGWHMYTNENEAREATSCSAICWDILLLHLDYDKVVHRHPLFDRLRQRFRSDYKTKRVEVLYPKGKNKIPQTLDDCAKVSYHRVGTDITVYFQGPEELENWYVQEIEAYLKSNLHFARKVVNNGFTRTPPKRKPNTDEERAEAERFAKLYAKHLATFERCLEGKKGLEFNRMMADLSARGVLTKKATPKSWNHGTWSRS